MLTHRGTHLCVAFWKDASSLGVQRRSTHSFTISAVAQQQARFACMKRPSPPSRPAPPGLPPGPPLPRTNTRHVRAHCMDKFGSAARLPAVRRLCARRATCRARSQPSRTAGELDTDSNAWSVTCKGTYRVAQGQMQTACPTCPKHVQTGVCRATAAPCLQAVHSRATAQEERLSPACVPASSRPGVPGLAWR